MVRVLSRTCELFVEIWHMMLPGSRDRFQILIDIMARERLDAAAISMCAVCLEGTFCRVYVHIGGIR